MTLEKQVARNLCDLMGDEWSLGRAMYLKRAREIIAMCAKQWSDEFAKAAQGDTENGVRSLNEEAAKRYLAEAPETMAVIGRIHEMASGGD